jgi:F-type H+-transporting ATPase subunit b
MRITQQVGVFRQPPGKDREPMLEINYTLAIQIANFLVLLFLLNLILYKPIRRILEQRNEEIRALETTALEYQDLSLEREKGIEAGMIEARKAGHSEKEGLKAQGTEEERKILEKANSTAQQRIGQARGDTESKMAEVRKALEDQVAVFSRELAGKILGRGV